MSEFSLEMVKKIAFLGRLSFNDDDLQKASRQLSDMVSYVEKLNEIDTTNVVPLGNPFEVNKPNREDVVKESLTVEDVLANAPQAKNQYFVIPKVI